MPTPLTSLILQEGGREYHSDLPVQLITGTGADPRPRLRVDPAQTSFFEGREFRSFYEFNIAPLGELVARFVSPIDFILHQQEFEVDSGTLRFVAMTTGTPGGSWTERPVIGVNRMASRPSPNYAAQCTFAVGGTHTGGTEVEIVRVKTNANTNFATTVNGGIQAERGLPAGTYYLHFHNLSSSDALTGVYNLRWEEVQPKSERIYG